MIDGKQPPATLCRAQPVRLFSVASPFHTLQLKGAASCHASISFYTGLCFGGSLKFFSLARVIA